MKIKTCMLLGIAAVFMLLPGVNSNNYASAEEQGTVTTNEGKGLSVSPSVDKLGYLKPGETYEREVTIVNRSEEDIAFKVLTSSFWVENEAYELKWGASESQYGKIANWTDIDSAKEYEVKVGETYKFKYRISVPEDQPGGTQRLMVTISLNSSEGEDESFIRTETHLNTLIYANIEGDVNPNAEIVSHSIQGFSFNSSISSSSVLKNTGDVDLDVTYKLNATKFFGGEQVFLDEEQKVLMTESSRMFEQAWTEAPYFGLFNVTQEITVLGEAHIFTGVVVICPLWMVIIVSIAIVSMIVYLVYRHNIRKKNQAK